jgi:ArpU family phage transcriptional regulator
MKRTTWIYSQVDRDATATKADEELSKWPHYWALSRRSAVALKSPGLDGMPKSPSKQNHAEDGILDKVSAETWVNRVKYVIEDMQMTNHRASQILQFLYMQGLPDTVAMERLGIEHTQYYEDRKDALVTFAEMWPPYPSDLVVHQS